MELSSIQYQIDALAVKMFKLDCSSCGENFIRMADLRKHTLLQHYGGTRQQGVKRKSIFDGIEMDKRNSKEARRSFLLVFTCNFCPDKFTRLGDFKKHQIVHEDEERAEVTDVTDESDNTDDEEVENGIARFALKKKTKISPWQKTFQKMFPTKRFSTTLSTLLKLRRVKLLAPLDHLNQSLEKHHPALQSLFRSLPPSRPSPRSICFLPESKAPGMTVVQPAYPLTLISRNPSPELCKTDSWHLLTHRP